MHALRSKVAKTRSKPAAVIAPEPPLAAPQPDPVIMNLSKRNDLNVNVISKEANRAKPDNTGIG